MQQKSSKKKRAAKVAAGVVAFQYSYVGNKAKYRAQADLLGKQARTLQGVGQGMAHDYRGMSHGGQAVLGAAFLGAAGYAGYKHRADLKRGAQWVNTQVHSKEHQRQAARTYGTALVALGSSKTMAGIRHRHPAGIAQGVAQGTAGVLIRRHLGKQSNRKGGNTEMARKKGIARKTGSGKVAWGAGRQAKKARRGERATEVLSKKKTSLGNGRLKRAAKQGTKASSKLSGTTWAKGKSPAQGSTPKKVSKPELGTAKFTKGMAKGKKTAARKGTSPKDGRKGAKK